MPVGRAAAWEIESNRGQNLWRILCRTALRAVDFSAQVFGLEGSENRVERAELLVSYGVHPLPPGNAPRPIDWARLGELERGRVAREMKGPRQR